MEIPTFSDRYVYNLNKQQEKFYKKLEKKWLKGKNDIDIKDNIGYMVHYIDCRQKDFFEHKEISRLNKELDVILTYSFNGIYDKDGFSYPTIIVNRIKKEAYLYLENYDEYWNGTFKKRLTNWEGNLQNIVDFNYIYNYLLKCKNYKINGQLLIACIPVKDAKITDYGREFLLELFNLMESFVESFVQEYNDDPFQYFMKNFATHELNDEEINKLKKYIKPKRFESLKKAYRAIYKQKKREYEELIRWNANDPSLVTWTPKDFYSEEQYYKRYNELKESFISRYELEHSYRLGKRWNGKDVLIPNESFPQLITEGFAGFCNLMLRECENILREKNNIPKIGEGWVSETRLFYLVKETFNSEIVLQHGKPLWLGRQHLDIYLPELNIGIEYQGAQHNEPIDYFGGEEKFTIQQKNDKRKYELCKKNDCYLIYIYPNYNESKVLMEIEKAIDYKKSSLSRKY